MTQISIKPEDEKPITDEMKSTVVVNPVLNICVKWLIVFWMLIYTNSALFAVVTLWLDQGQTLCNWLNVDDCTRLSSVFISSIYSMFGGILGAGVLGMVSFHQFASLEGIFDIRHGWGFLFAPFLASILGLMVFALMQSGLMIFSGTAADAETSATTNLGYLSIGFLSGFGWYPATQRINQIVSRFFNVKGNNPEPNTAKSNREA